MPGKYQLRNTYLVALSIFGLHTTFNHCKNLKYNICSLCCYESLNCCLSDLYVKICKISWITFINLFYQNFYHRMMSFIWMWVVDVCLLYIFYMYFIYIHLRKFVFCNFIYELLLLRSIENYNMKYTFYIILYNKKLVCKSTNPGLCYVIDCIKCNIIIIQSLCTLRINRTLRPLSKV